MLHKTRGVVFRFTKYGETSIIASIFTEHFGLQSYIINGARSKSAKGKIALYQPLTLLDMVVYHKENANIMRIKEVKCFHPYQELSSDIKKSTIAFFLNEIVNKCVKEQSHPQELCDFLFNSLVSLDNGKQVENFHLIFLIQLSRLLGFGPYNPEDILTGLFLSDEEQSLLLELLQAGYASHITINTIQRRNILDVLLRFYTTHMDNFGEVRSLPVLRELIN
jgi:DNA repair protein RecO (recombination protein O)